MHKNQTVRLITFTALLVALGVILDRLSLLNPGWKIGFGFIPVVVAAVLYGPAVSAIVYGLSDLLAALLFPIGPYFPGFTVCAAVMGAVYGVFLYNKRARFFPNIVLPPVINCLIGLFVNTIWVSILYDSKAYWGWFVYRLPQYAILIPLNLVLIPAIIHLCGKLKKFTLKRVR